MVEVVVGRWFNVYLAIYYIVYMNELPTRVVRWKAFVCENVVGVGSEVVAKLYPHGLLLVLVVVRRMLDVVSL